MANVPARPKSTQVAFGIPLTAIVEHSGQNYLRVLRRTVLFRPYCLKNGLKLGVLICNDFFKKKKQTEHNRSECGYLLNERCHCRSTCRSIHTVCSSALALVSFIIISSLLEKFGYSPVSPSLPCGAWSSSPGGRWAGKLRSTDPPS